MQQKIINLIFSNFWIASFLAMTLRTMAVRHCEGRSNPEVNCIFTFIYANLPMPFLKVNK